MKLRPVALAAGALWVGSCHSPMAWEKSGGTQEQYDFDRSQCEASARQGGYYGTGLGSAQAMKGFIQQCMASRGYTVRA